MPSPSLSQIEAEAQQLIGRMPVERRCQSQAALLTLCENHWRELRGVQPLTHLAQSLWSIAPPSADLFIDLYVTGDAHAAEIVPERTLTRGLALLVMAEIERGHEAAIHIAHESMQAFETTVPSAELLERIQALLHGTLEPPLIHPHDKHGALWQALAVMAAQTRRLDLPAIMAEVHLLVQADDPHTTLPDADLDALRHAVAEAGIQFLAVEDEHIHFAQHERVHDPIRRRFIGELLQELRQKWLA